MKRAILFQINDEWKTSSTFANGVMRHASKGTLQPQVLADLIALKKFSEAQVLSFRKLWGPDLPSSRAREHLLRMIVIEFGFGRLRAITYYTQGLSSLFGTDEITREISQLEDVELIVRGDDDELAPSQQVVDWYNHVMPIVMDEVTEVIRSR